MASRGIRAYDGTILPLQPLRSRGRAIWFLAVYSRGETAELRFGPAACKFNVLHAQVQRCSLETPYPSP